MISPAAKSSAARRRRCSRPLKSRRPPPFNPMKACHTARRRLSPYFAKINRLGRFDDMSYLTIRAAEKTRRAARLLLTMVLGIGALLLLLVPPVAAETANLALE